MVALTAKAAESRTKTQPMPTAQISAPARAGPASWEMLLATPISELAFCRSGPGPATARVTSGARLGRLTAEATPATAWAVAISGIEGWPPISWTATRAWVATRVRSAPKATQRVLYRSATTPATGSASSRAPRAQPSTTARAVAEPVTSITARLRAVGTRASLSVDMVRLAKSSRKSRSRSG